jgi:hypothetical protein
MLTGPPPKFNGTRDILIGYPARTKSDIAYSPAFISSKRCAMCATDRER